MYLSHTLQKPISEWSCLFYLEFSIGCDFPFLRWCSIFLTQRKHWNLTYFCLIQKMNEAVSLTQKEFFPNYSFSVYPFAVANLFVNRQNWDSWSWESKIWSWESKTWLERSEIGQHFECMVLNKEQFCIQVTNGNIWRHWTFYREKNSSLKTKNLVQNVSHADLPSL